MLHLSEKLHEMGYKLIYVDPDVWILIAVKTNGVEYYEYIFFYVDDVICISDDLVKYMNRIQEYSNHKYEIFQSLTCTLE